MLDVGFILNRSPLGRLWTDSVFVIVDLETTGFSSSFSAITEIGAVKIRGTEVLEEFQTFVNAGVSIPWRITEITGISQSHIDDAPTPDIALAEFLDFAEFHVEDQTTGYPILVAHNAPFDVGFLKAGCARHDINWPSPTTLDTVKFANRVLSRGTVDNYKLDTLANHFAVPTAPNHRALDDAKATTEVLWNLIDIAVQRVSADSKK